MNACGRGWFCVYFLHTNHATKMTKNREKKRAVRSLERRVLSFLHVLPEVTVYPKRQRNRERERSPYMFGSVRTWGKLVGSEVRTHTRKKKARKCRYIYSSSDRSL